MCKKFLLLLILISLITFGFLIFNFREKEEIEVLAMPDSNLICGTGSSGTCPTTGNECPGASNCSYGTCECVVTASQTIDHGATYKFKSLTINPGVIVTISNYAAGGAGGCPGSTGANGIGIAGGVGGRGGKSSGSYCGTGRPGGNTAGGGGGGAAYIANGCGGTGGSDSGGGGGGACRNDTWSGVAGGAGGGKITIEAGESITITGTLRANGANGPSGGCPTGFGTRRCGGGGGGGGGGNITLIGRAVTLSGTIQALGGRGGNGGTSGDAHYGGSGGGGGGGGAVFIYTSSYSKTGTISMQAGAGGTGGWGSSSSGYAGEPGTGGNIYENITPSVTTSYASNVEGTQAILHGVVNNCNGACTNRGFEWGTVSGIYSDSWTQAGGVGSFNHTITIVPGTTYYFRATATNAGGKGYGSEKTFPFSPTVNTEDVDIDTINECGATLEGNITDTGGPTVDERGFEWGTTQNGPYPNSWPEFGSWSLPGTYDSGTQINNLLPNTKYYFRAKAHNSAPGSWGYGQEKSFTTLSSPKQYSAPLTFNTEGDHYVRFFSVDTSGNKEEVKWKKISVVFNQPPTVSNVQETCDYCNHTGDPQVLLGGTITLNWDYFDNEGDPQTYYEVLVDTDSSFSDPKFNHRVDPGLCNSGDRCSYVLDLSQDDSPDWSSSLSWSTSYYWKVIVSDGTAEVESGFDSFTTPDHAYPWPKFTKTPDTPTLGEAVQFCAVSQTIEVPCESGPCYQTICPVEVSKCYDSGANEYPSCNDAPVTYFWEITEGSGEFTDSGITETSSKNPSATFSGTKVKLTITDPTVGVGSGSCSKEEGITSTLPLPKWKEILPF